MKSVWKYPLPILDEFGLFLPAGAELLCVQTQKHKPCLWALVDTQAAVELRRFRCAGTGHPIEPSEVLRYLDTIQLENGALVFHYFEDLSHQ